MSDLLKQNLYGDISQLIREARSNVRRAVNSAMVISYWNVGRMIVEDEQAGEQRAAYGKAVLKELAIKLTAEFGKGFDYRNLQYMKKFFLSFSIVNAVSSQSKKQHSLSTDLKNSELPILGSSNKSVID